MQVLLTTLNAKYIHINLAIRLLYMRNKDKCNLSWHEFTIKEDQTSVAAHCSQFEVVCFSCYIWNITQTLEVCKQIKLLNPNTKILLGGPEVSYEFSDIIANDAVDYIIVGEGEIPFEQFIQHYPNIELVPNLVYKQNEEIKYNKQNVSFDLINYENQNPYLYDDPKNLYNKVCYIETSRGCPYKCEFCLASLDNKVRYLPTDTIKQQLLYLMQHGRVIKFLDRTFNVKKDFTLDIFQFILDNHKPENVFQFEITADIVHPDIIAFINEKVPKGLFRFEIGIQTVNKNSNLAVSRKQNFDKTADVIKQLQNKIEMHLDLIVGLPLDYWEDTKYSFEKVFALHPPELQLGFLKFLKGTPVREKYEQYEYEFDPAPPYQIIKSKFLSDAELAQITIVENALEIYWNKKRAIHTLKYVESKYSIFDFFNGLGNLFVTQKEFHQYGINDVFAILIQYAKEHFENDLVLHQLIALDYYSFYKVRPKDIVADVTLNKTAMLSLLPNLGYNMHLQRFAVMQIDFCWHSFITTNKIEKAKNLIVIGYNGTTAPIINAHQNVALV
jgi:anaerobic magnesium-protoporphyrin IX monomethyl ester cyclase